MVGERDTFFLAVISQGPRPGVAEEGRQNNG